MPNAFESNKEKEEGLNLEAVIEDMENIDLSGFIGDRLNSAQRKREEILDDLLKNISAKLAKAEAFANRIRTRNATDAVELIIRATIAKAVMPFRSFDSSHRDGYREALSVARKETATQKPQILERWGKFPDQIAEDIKNLDMSGFTEYERKQEQPEINQLLESLDSAQKELKRVHLITDRDQINAVQRAAILMADAATAEASHKLGDVQAENRSTENKKVTEAHNMCYEQTIARYRLENPYKG